MVISIKRTYFTDCTNGESSVDGKLRCYSIELPWKDNQHGISCIPEGKYKLVKHLSDHLGRVLLITNVPNRDLCYIHAANNAVLELKGCIAPVTALTGHGLGAKSKLQLEPLLNEAYGAIDREEDVYLIIQSK